MVFAVQMHEPARKAGCNPCLIPPYKRGVRRFKSYCADQVLQLDGLIETLIGGPVTTAGNHRCTLPDGEGAQRPWQHPLGTPGRARRRRQAPPALERHAGLEDPPRLASLMHACIVVSLMAGVRPEKARAIEVRPLRSRDREGKLP
jgi:hypothetical protein